MKFLRKKEDPRIESFLSFFFFFTSFLKILFTPPPFFLPIHPLSPPSEGLYSSSSQYLSQCRVTEERINMYRETCCHFKARTAVAFILSSRWYVHEGNAPLGKVDTYVQWNSIRLISTDFNSLLHFQIYSKQNLSRAPSTYLRKDKITSISGFLLRKRFKFIPLVYE